MPTIDISKMEIESPFFFSAEQPLDQRFLQNVKTYGILTPLYGFYRSDILIPLTGRKRLSAARELGLTEIPVNVLEELTQVDLWLFALQESRPQGDFTEMEIAQILSQTLLMSTEEDFSPILNVLNIHLDTQRKKIYHYLLTLPPPLKNYLNRYPFSIKQIEAVMGLSVELLIELVHIAEKLSIRPVEFIDMTNAFYEIMREQDEEFITIYQKLRIKEVLESGNNRNQKIQAIKQELHRQRYPRLSKINEELLTLSKNLPKFVSVSWDKTLEKSNLSIILDSGTSTAIKEQANLLVNEEVSLILEKMQTILRG